MLVIAGMVVRALHAWAIDDIKHDRRSVVPHSHIYWATWLAMANSIPDNVVLQDLQSGHFAYIMQSHQQMIHSVRIRIYHHWTPRLQQSLRVATAESSH